MANTHATGKAFLVTIDGMHVAIPLDEALYTNWQNQFQQKNGKIADARKLTLRNLIKAAYRAGQASKA